MVVKVVANSPQHYTLLKVTTIVIREKKKEHFINYTASQQSGHLQIWNLEN